MTDFNDVKVGDRIRFTAVYEGEVTALKHADKSLKVEGVGWLSWPTYLSNVSNTIEIIERPREIGWWEVEVDDCGLPIPRTFRWDGKNWLISAGSLSPWKNHKINPLHYIGKGSADE